MGLYGVLPVGRQISPDNNPTLVKREHNRDKYSCFVLRALPGRGPACAGVRMPVHPQMRVDTVHFPVIDDCAGAPPPVRGTAMRDGKGNLRIIGWGVAEDGSLTRQGTATAGAVSRVFVAKMGGGKLVAAMRDGKGRLRLISWDVRTPAPLRERPKP